MCGCNPVEGAVTISCDTRVCVTHAAIRYVFALESPPLSCTYFTPRSRLRSSAMHLFPQLIGIMEGLLKVTEGPEPPLSVEDIVAKLTFMSKVKADYVPGV